MGVFWVMVIILTVIYIIYYAYTVMKDLYARKSDGKSSTEEFSVADMAVSSPTAVTEKDGSEQEPEYVAATPLSSDQDDDGSSGEEAIRLSLEQQEAVVHEQHGGLYDFALLAQMSSPTARLTSDISMTVRRK